MTGPSLKSEMEQITIVTSDLVTSATVPQAQPDLTKGQVDTYVPDTGDQAAIKESLLNNSLRTQFQNLVGGASSE